MAFSPTVAQRGIDSPYNAQIATSAAAYGVDPALVKAVIAQESNWSPQAYRAEPQISDASYGLMQVLLATAKSVTGNPRLTAGELFAPDLNIDIGTRYLATQVTRFGYPEGISAYNAGRPISGNQLSYVEPVLAYQAWYQEHDPLFGNPPVPPVADAGGGILDWLFGPTPSPTMEPIIDPVTGEVVTPDTTSADILSEAGIGIGVLVLSIGALWVLTRRGT